MLLGGAAQALTRGGTFAIAGVLVLLTAAMLAFGVARGSLRAERVTQV